MTSRPCDTYTAWSPTAQTVTARCPCGWAGPTRHQTAIIDATNDEIDHLIEYLTKQPKPTP
jgi:hypothetical protein